MPKVKCDHFSVWITFDGLILSKYKGTHDLLSWQPSLLVYVTCHISG